MNYQKHEIDIYLPFQVDQNDKQLTKYIRENWIRPPSKLQYQLHNPERRDHSMGQSAAVDHILQQKVHKNCVKVNLRNIVV